MKIYMITHAHTEQSPDVAVDTWRLSQRGIGQAEALANAPFWDEVDRVILSSESKTWLTVAEVVKARNLPVWIDSRFDELRRGGWIVNYADQVAAAFGSPDIAMGEWERVNAVRERALQGLADVRRRFVDETVAVVGHGLCLSILRAEILGHRQIDIAAWRNLDFAAVACVVVTPCTLDLAFDFKMSDISVRA